MSKALRGYGFAALLVLGGCGLESSPDSYHNPKVDADAYAAQRGSIFGADGLDILGGKGSKNQNGGGGGIGVNSYLWRASLDTVTFMPLASADPFGGVIITDWYSPPETPLERFKVNIFILDRELRSDGLRATMITSRSRSMMSASTLRWLLVPMPNLRGRPWLASSATWTASAI